MSSNFAERFKGRIEAFSKEGVGRITVPTGNPVNAIRDFPGPLPATAGGPPKDTHRFSQNAQANILDFQRRYQPMLRPEQDVPYYYETDPGFNHPYRGVYSAFDPSRNPHPHYARMTDGYVHPPASDPQIRPPYPAEGFGKRSSLVVPGSGAHPQGPMTEAGQGKKEINLKLSDQSRQAPHVRGISEKPKRVADVAKENFNYGGLGPNYNKFWADK